MDGIVCERRKILLLIESNYICMLEMKIHCLIKSTILLECNHIKTCIKRRYFKAIAIT